MTIGRVESGEQSVVILHPGYQLMP